MFFFFFFFFFFFGGGGGAHLFAHAFQRRGCPSAMEHHARLANIFDYLIRATKIESTSQLFLLGGVRGVVCSKIEYTPKNPWFKFKRLDLDRLGS